MRYYFYYLLIINLLLLVNDQNIWWMYSAEDSDIIFNNVNGVETKFLNDQTKCYRGKSNCHSANSELESDPPFDNKCCLVKSSSYNSCMTLFKGKYYEGNLYSLIKGYKTFSLDCDGKGDITYNHSTFNPKESWEITIKEKYDCIYSKNEDQCQKNPKSFIQNTKCCWFSDADYSSYSQCFGLSELVDNEFRRTIPYLSRAGISRTNKEMDFRCYDKSDKVVKGKYNFDYDITEMGSVQEKLLQEMLSDDPLESLSKKQNFIKIKEYDKTTLYNSFQLWTISPNTEVKKYVVSCKFSYKITESRMRILETKTEEKTALCKVDGVDTNNELNITTSTCTFSNDEGYEGEKIEIQPGHDLIGKFDDENKIATLGMSSSDEEINKLKDVVFFNFKDPITNLKSTTFEGKITEDRKNVEFVLYHQKNNETIENIIGKADFLKNSKTVHFTTEPEINFDEGITIIPNQLVKSEDGKYLYLKNQIKGNTTEYYDSEEKNDEESIHHNIKKKNSGLSAGTIVAIIIPCCLALLIIFILACVLRKSYSNSNISDVSQHSNVAINN